MLTDLFSKLPYMNTLQDRIAELMEVSGLSVGQLAGVAEVARTEIRTKLSQQAQSTQRNHIYVIRAPKPDEVGGSGYGAPQTVISTEWIELSS